MKSIRIGKTEIGRANPVYFIAEIGVNHNGKIELAHELIDQAKMSGANAVKFQTFSADRIVTRSSPKAHYQIANTGEAQSQYAMLKELEMPESWYPDLRAHCEQVELDFLSTPYDIEDIETLWKYGVNAYKVPSAWAVDPEYLAHMADLGMPILLSTGMCTITEVSRAVETILPRNEQVVLLQCTTDYPTAPEDCNVLAVKTLQNFFKLPVGLSDHSRSHLPSVMAVTLGACLIERHFTLDKSMPGPDHSSSDTPQEFTALVNTVRDARIMLGRAEKRPVAAEKANLTARRRSLVANRFIKKGEALSRHDLALKRPTGGIEPRFLPLVMGRQALRNLEPDQQIAYEDVGLDEAISLRLEELTPGSLPELTEMFAQLTGSADERLFHPHPFTSEQARALCTRTGKDYFALMVVNGETAGYVMLRGWDEGHTFPFAGYYVKPEFRNKGLGTEALRLLLPEAKQRGASEVRAKTYTSNVASVRAFRKAGFAEQADEQGLTYFHALLI